MIRNYKKKTLCANIKQFEREGKTLYLVTTSSLAKEFATLLSAENYLLKKGYIRI